MIQDPIGLFETFGQGVIIFVHGCFIVFFFFISND